MWDLGSLTQDRTLDPCSGAQTLTHWTTREVLRGGFLEGDWSAALKEGAADPSSQTLQVALTVY